MDAVEEVKARLAIEDVIGEYVTLKRAGRSFKGLSPFTAEKTPSFVVSPEKQIWHDFSSNKGGNMFSFVMEMEGLDFKGALELLARKAGVDLTQYQTGRSADNAKLKERLLQAVELATRFYQAQFKGSQEALEYIFKKREFTKETVLAFRLGYSPNNGSALKDFLKKKGFSDKELSQAGLTSRFNQDMFRGRIMVPLADAQGKVVGFTARLLEDDPDAPKYINTPQTLLYDKGRHVFGLHLAKDAIRTEKFAVLVEGNLDVIGSYQAGVRNVVATAGTALTEMQLKTLSRFSGDIRLAFDADRAGLAATERAIPIAGKVGVSLSILTIPEGKDPDELARKDPKAWREVIDKNQYAIDWLMERYTQELDLKTAQGKREFSDIMLRVIRQLPDRVEQDHYLQKIATQLGVSMDAMQTKLSKPDSPQRLKKRTVQTDAQVDKMLLETMKSQDQLLAIALMVPSLRSHLEIITPEMLPSEDAQKLFTYLKEHPDFDGKLGPAKALHKIADYVKIVSLQYETLYLDLEEVELDYEAARLQIRLIKQYVETKKASLSQQLHEADEGSSRKLLEQVKQLDQLLKQTTEVVHGR
jgi:DNA primase